MFNKLTLTTAVSSITTLGIMSSALPSYAVDWVLVTESVGGDQIYVDADSFERRGQTAWYWEKHVYAEQKDGIAVDAMYYSTDCRNGISRLRRLVTYNVQGEVVDSLDEGDKGPAKSYVPGSVKETVFRAVCNR